MNRQPLADTLRLSIRCCGLTSAEIARRAGLDKKIISRFLNGYDLRLSSVEKLAPVTGVEFRFRLETTTCTYDQEGTDA